MQRNGMVWQFRFLYVALSKLKRVPRTALLSISVAMAERTSGLRLHSSLS